MNIINKYISVCYYKTEDKLYNEKDIKKLLKQMQSKYLVIQLDIGQGTQ